MRAADWQQATLVSSQPTRVHRLQIKGAVVVTMQTALLEQDAAYLAWALYTQDLEDTDSLLWNSPGNVFASERILAYGVLGFSLLETAAPSTLAGPDARPIRLDLKFRPALKVAADSRITLAFEWAAGTPGTTIALARWSSINRISVQPPNVGR